MEQEMLRLILVEMREMKEDMSEVKTTLKKVDVRLTNVEDRLTGVEDRLTGVEGRLSNVEELAEFNKENIIAIKNGVSSNYMEFKKFIKSNKIQHKLYDSNLLQFNKEK